MARAMLFGVAAALCHRRESRCAWVIAAYVCTNKVRLSAVMPRYGAIRMKKDSECL